MKTTRWQDLRRAKLSPEAMARVDTQVQAELLEMDLKALREVTGVTQTRLAELVEMSQPEISRMERRSDYLLSTLKKVVHALGGELEVIADFGDKRVRLAI